MLDAGLTADVWSRVAPEPEAVTLKSRKAGGSQASFHAYELPRAKRKRLTKTQVQAFGAYLASAWRVWQFWADSIAEAVPVGDAPSPCPDPKVGDQVQGGDGVTWVVVDAENKLFGNVWNLVCEKAKGG